jgi:CTP:phosphocholine cytidylyltransferase-like protein
MNITQFSSIFLFYKKKWAHSIKTLVYKDKYMPQNNIFRNELKNSKEFFYESYVIAVGFITFLHLLSFCDQKISNRDNEIVNCVSVRASVR